MMHETWCQYYDNVMFLMLKWDKLTTRALLRSSFHFIARSHHVSKTSNITMFFLFLRFCCRALFYHVVCLIYVCEWNWSYQCRGSLFCVVSNEILFNILSNKKRQTNDIDWMLHICDIPYRREKKTVEKTHKMMFFFMTSAKVIKIFRFDKRNPCQKKRVKWQKIRAMTLQKSYFRDAKWCQVINLLIIKVTLLTFFW